MTDVLSRISMIENELEEYPIPYLIVLRLKIIY